MNIIVSNNTIEYDGFMKLKTLEEVLEVVGSINCLVYHKSNESREEKVNCLTKLKDRVNTFVYIRDKDSLEQAVQMVVVGSGGKYFDDEFFLESAEELNRLISSLDEVTTLAELGGVNVVTDFFNRYLKNGSSGFNKNYLSIVKEAVSSMISDYKSKDLELLQLSETATEIFANSVEIITKVEKESENLKSLVSTLKAAKDEYSFNLQSKPTNIPSILFFPQVPYLKEKTIFRVKELGSCAYLTSFMLGFRLYLEHIKYLRPKLIFICSVGEQYELLYNNYKWVTQQSSKNMGNYYDSIVFTNFPTKEVVHRLLDDTDYDTFIVVDRMKSSEKHILNSKGGSIKYCVSGENSIEKSKVKVSSCFSTKNQQGMLFKMPIYIDYPKEKDQRERLYLRDCIKQYESLYSMRKV